MSATSKPDPVPRLRKILSPHVEEFDAAAEAADELELEDTARILAAIGRGEKPPRGPAQRMSDRLSGGD